MTKIRGLTRCTAWSPPKEELVSNKTLGPDAGWTLLKDEPLRIFCASEGENLVHRGRVGYDHVCASFGEWAFDAEDHSYIRTVVFLHYRTPRKAAARLGDVDVGAGTKVFSFTGAKLFETYQSLLGTESGEVHVWRRETHGEIAIDFCLHSGARKHNAEGRLKLPTFIPT